MLRSNARSVLHNYRESRAVLSPHSPALADPQDHGVHTVDPFYLSLTPLPERGWIARHTAQAEFVEKNVKFGLKRTDARYPAWSWEGCVGVYTYVDQQV
jgi:hypothetical protein